MLTRLKVSGFKNLVDVDVQFGAFTCIAGVNGVGKSNLFDAIRFLSALADRPLLEAAMSVRDEDGHSGDIKSIFHRVGGHFDRNMSFEAEMIVPQDGVDDLGQPAKASITFLKYSLDLALREDHAKSQPERLEITKEELVHITRGDANRHLQFPHSTKEWRDSVVVGRRSGAHFISTDDEQSGTVIKLHQDSGGDTTSEKKRGRALSRSARNLPRTVLSVTNSAESPTALLARREMQSWRLLQLEPSALRKPDGFSSHASLGSDGAHLPATLYRLARQELSDPMDAASRMSDSGLISSVTHIAGGKAEESLSTSKSPLSNARAYVEVANRLSELISDVREVWVDRDEKREVFTLQVTGNDGTTHAARSLSDGTLRFLALAVLELDADATGLLCLEEPENGIHPARIPAVLQLLQEIAVDVEEPAGSDNPLRQVIINTHSPVVVGAVPDDSLLVAQLHDAVDKGRRFKQAHFRCLPNTWRSKNMPSIAKGELLAYLAPYAMNTGLNGVRRVIDRLDFRQLSLPLLNQAK